MELNELLKQFKNIEPDKGFSRRSLHLILYSMPARKSTAREIFLNSVEFAAAVALSGLFIFMVVGGLSSSNIPSPLQISSLNPSTLQAEAHAIDIQIELVNLNYNLGSIAGATSSESTPPVAHPSNGPASIVLPNSIPASSFTPTSTFSVDQALEQLSK